MENSPKLPVFSGYCPPGQLRSMSRRLAQQALVAARVRQARRAPDSPQHRQLVNAAAAHWASRQARANLALVGLALLLVVAACLRRSEPLTPPANDALVGIPHGLGLCAWHYE